MEQATVNGAEDGADAPGGEAIRLEGVSKRFGDFTAVDAIDLSIPKGEFFSLLGPSGCGKTTTLRMLAGFEIPTEGRILLEGEPVEDVPPYRRNVNMVFQSYALFGHLDIADNVAFGLKRRKVPKDEIRRRVDEALELVSLESRATARPSELSGGQRQRVALARALVNRPAVLLLDEPLGALDLKLRRQMQVELKQIQREVGITFVYVTHDQEEALSMSDRIAVMSDGRIAQCGEPEEVYEHPNEEFVAGFIGISNMLEGVVDGPGMVKVGSGMRIPAPVPGDCDLRRHRPAVGPTREDRRRRGGRGRHGQDERQGDLADLPRGQHPAHGRSRRRSAPRRPRAGHLSRQRRRPLGGGHGGECRMAPRELSASSVEGRRRRGRTGRTGRRRRPHHGRDRARSCSRRAIGSADGFIRGPWTTAPWSRWARSSSSPAAPRRSGSPSASDLGSGTRACVTGDGSPAGSQVPQGAMEAAVAEIEAALGRGEGEGRNVGELLGSDRYRRRSTTGRPGEGGGLGGGLSRRGAGGGARATRAGQRSAVAGDRRRQPAPGRGVGGGDRDRGGQLRSPVRAIGGRRRRRRDQNRRRRGRRRLLHRRRPGIGGRWRSPSTRPFPARSPPPWPP